MEVGLGFQSNKTADEYRTLAANAEAYGIDVLTVFSDLMYQPPIVALTIMAQATSRVRLGAACLNPYTVAPHEIAGQVAALDIVSQGRAYLGLARGSWLGAVGIDQARPVTTLGEAAEVCRRLLAGEDDGFEGEVFRLDPGLRLRFTPYRREIPLLIGTWGPSTARYAGTVAAEVKIGGSANPDILPWMRSLLDEGAAEVGRAPGSVGIVCGAVTVVDDDGVAARRRAREEVVMYLAVVADLDPTIHIADDLLYQLRRRVEVGDMSSAATLISDELLDRFAFAGTPKQVAAQARRLFDAGARRVEFGTPHGLSDARGLELIGTDVLPALAATP